MWSLRTFIVAGAVGGAVLSHTAFAFGQSAPNAALERRIEQLETQVKELKGRQVEDQGNIPVSQQGRVEDLDQAVGVLQRRWDLGEGVTAEKAKQAAVSAGNDGFSLKSADGNYQIRFRGLIHADGRFFLDDDDSELVNSFVMRRVRPILAGTVAKYFDFYFVPDFGEGKTVIQDAYINTKVCPEFQLRAGKGKTPFGLERLQSASDIEFVERSLPNNIVPNRDLGVQIHGDLWDGVLFYNVGIFNGVPDGGSGDGDNQDDKDFAARVFVHPFKTSDCGWIEGLGVGVATTVGNAQGTVASPNLPSYKTPGQQTFFSFRSGAGGAFADGDRFRISPQAYYYFRSFGFLTEYVMSEQDIVLGASAASIQNDAWQTAVYYVLTGENASYRSVTPSKPFDPHCGQWGAFELVARYSELNIDNGAFPVFADAAKSAEAARAWSVGLNWYLTRNVKVVFDYERTSFDGGGAGGRDRKDEQVIFTRMQLAF